MEKAVNTFFSFSYEIATKDSNSFVTFGRQTHDNCAATEGNTRLHGEHRDMEERARTQNSAVHKLFACKRNRMRSRSWPLFAERTRHCLLAKAFEAMRDRKKSRTSSRFVSVDAVAHRELGSVIPAPLCARFHRPASTMPATDP